MLALGGRTTPGIAASPDAALADDAPLAVAFGRGGVPGRGAAPAAACGARHGCGVADPVPEVSGHARRGLLGRCRGRPPARRSPPRQRRLPAGWRWRRRGRGPVGLRRRGRRRMAPRRLVSRLRQRLAPPGRPGCGRRAVDRGRVEMPVVDETDHAVRRQRPAVGVGVDREAGVGVRADRVEHPARVAGHDLDVVLEQHPVARLGLVIAADRVPAAVRLRVRHDGRDAGRRRVRVDPDIGPDGQRIRVGLPAADPALLADRLRGQFQGEAGEGRARRPVVGAVQAGVVPDERLHLGRTAGPRDLQVVLGDVDDGRPEQRIAGAAVGAVAADGPGIHGRARLCRLLEGEQVQWHAGRRGHRRGRPWDEVEAGNHAAGGHGNERRRLLPPWLPDGMHGSSSPLPR